jgi:hypothetical protein
MGVLLSTLDRAFRRAKAWEAPCHDCGIDTAPCSGKGRGSRILKRDVGKWEWYMVKDDVWAAAGMPPDDETVPVGESGYLCIGCLETRLGRPLTRADFKYPEAHQEDELDTPRLRDRLRAGVSNERIKCCRRTS